jgi:hypothetical protein
VTDEKDGKGKHKAVFQTSERAVTAANSRTGRPLSDIGMSYQWAR